MAEKGKRGFASMDREKQRQIASKGGKAAHEKGRAHEFTPEEARIAGRKGGLAAHHRVEPPAPELEEAPRTDQEELEAKHFQEAYSRSGYQNGAHQQLSELLSTRRDDNFSIPPLETEAHTYESRGTRNF